VRDDVPARAGSAQRPTLRAEVAETIRPVAAQSTDFTYPLPQPEDAPTDPRADVPVVPIGEIEIPKIGLIHTVYEGVWLTVVDHGPGHWPGTAEPGGWGNSVFAGHRVTNSHPFRRIDELAPSDEIIVRNDRGVFTYQVTGNQVVDESAMHIVDQAPGRTITIFACHPPGSAQFRFVVFGALVRADPPVGA